MSRWRIVVVALLILAPFVGLAGAGGYFLWVSGARIYVWLVMFACLSTGYLLGSYWQHKRHLLRSPEFDAPLAWTERDKQAWALVEARAKAAPQINLDKLTDLDYYVDQGKAMAQELAAFYNPHAVDPVAALTIPEILAVVELASQDMAQLVDQYLPGGHLLTISDLRLARRATDWYESAVNVYWVIAAVFNPVETGLRYAASKVGLSQPLQKLQQNLLVWFYTSYVHRLGTYLVELNSGRLRIGAARYRQIMREQAPPDGQAAPRAAAARAPAEPDAADGVKRVTITLMGQVKAGKSSLVNALLGERRAQTDVLPMTAEVTRYEVQPAGIPTRLVLLDTVGYGHAGPKEDQLRATQESARQSDLLLLVLHARNPARQADLTSLEKLRAWFASRPDLKMPRILAVVTHIDLLSPAMEWAPPYDWQRPTRTKEQQIDQAVAAVREQLGEFLHGVVPVCAADGKVYGVEEYLMPAVANLLDEAHGVALLRVLRAEFDALKVRKVFHQLLAAGKGMGKVVWQALAKAAAEPRPSGKGGKTTP